ncbi:NUDIX hydrolase [Roseovarius sp. CH_XMU1461]|uniref:NUDIX hydrolase n=1 Tax=Roseovarius sp. CH_XMU1461 TaxID=3107777 RepID=UPI003009D183
MIRQAPISVDDYDKRDMRSQFAALCFRMKKGKPQVLMITTRGSGRWIIPKGWPMPGRTPAEAALIEAWEEAGVQGKGYDQCLGVFSYHKLFTRTDGAPCLALVYPIKVKALAQNFPEKGQRKRKWMGLDKAATKVDEPELAQILRQFNPKHLPKPIRAKR